MHLLHDVHGLKSCKPIIAPLALLPKEVLASPMAGMTTMLQRYLPSVRVLVQYTSAQGLRQARKTNSWNISMIPQPFHPWLPQKMVWGGLPLVAVLIRLVPDAPFAAEELDAVLSNQLPAAHQPAMGSLFLTGLLLFLARDAQIAAQHVENASFAAGLASKPVACHAAILLIDGCDRAPIAKSLPCLQCQGCCLMHQLMTYTR